MYTILADFLQQRWSAFSWSPQREWDERPPRQRQFLGRPPSGAIRGTEWGVRRRRKGVIVKKLGLGPDCHRRLPQELGSRVRAARSCHCMQRLDEHPLDKVMCALFRVFPLPRRKFANCLDTKNVPYTALCARKRHANPCHVPASRSSPMDDARMMGADCGQRLGPRYFPPPCEYYHAR